MAAQLSLSDVNLHFGGVKVLQDVSFDVEAGCHLRARRPERRRQDIAVQLHQRPLQAQLRLDHDRRDRGGGQRPVAPRPDRPGAHLPASGPQAQRHRPGKCAARWPHPAPGRPGVVGAGAAVHGPCRARHALRGAGAARARRAWAGPRTCPPTSSRTACTRASSSGVHCSPSPRCFCSTSPPPGCRTARSSSSSRPSSRSAPSRTSPSSSSSTTWASSRRSRTGSSCWTTAASSWRDRGRGAVRPPRHRGLHREGRRG